MPEPDAPRTAVAGRRRPARPGIVPVPRTGRLALSLQQEDLWFLDRLAAGRPVYNVDFVLRFHGELDVPTLERAATALVARHESLRTRFGSEHGVPYQVIDPPAPVELPVTDLSGLPAEERGRRERELIERGVREPYDLERGPLLRLRLLRLAPAEHALLLSASHLVIDGWSVQTVVRELGALYEAARRGEPDPLPPLPVQYADFAAWQRGPGGAERLQRQLDHWAGRLAGVPALDFPADRPRPDRPTWEGRMAVRRLPDGLYDELEALARAESTYLLPVVLAGFLAVLARYTGQRDLAVGTAASGRIRRELNDQVGFYVNMLVLRCPLPAPDPTFRELLALAGHTALDALGHQEVPFGRVVTALRPDREPNRNPLFQVALVLQIPKERVELPGLTIDATITWELGVNPGTSRFDLTVNAGRFGGEFQLLTEFSTELFDADRIDRLHGHLLTVLEHAVRSPDARLSELPLLTDAERRQLDAWSERAAGAPRVLDAWGQLAPAGVEGELWLDGRPAGARARWRAADGVLERLDVAPEPAAPVRDEPEDEGPRTPTEEALADIWRGVFGSAAEGVSVHESFFAIGGSSLQAVELMTRVQEAFPVELDLRDVFTESSIAQLGALIDRQLGLEGLSDEEVLRLLQAEEQ